MRSFSDHLPTTNIKNLIFNIRWAFGLTWSTDKHLLSGMIAMTSIESLLPAGLALAARGLVNSVAAMLESNTQDTTALLFWLGLGLILTLATAVSTAVNGFLTQRLQDELNLRITSDILVHAAKLDFAYFEDPRFQDIMQRARQDTAQHFSAFVSIILRISTICIQIISLVVILTAIEPIITLLLIPIGIPHLYFQWCYARKRFAEAHSRTTKNRWTGYFVSHLTSAQSVAEVKLLGLAPLFTRQFRSLMTEFRDRDRKLYLYGLTGNIVFAVLSIAAIYFAFGRATFHVLNDGLTIGDIAIFGTAASRLRAAVESLIGNVSNLRWQAMHISNLVTFFDIEPQLTDAGMPLPASSRGEIEIKNISFTYPGMDHAVLSDISLHIRPGETVALVGENGAGKTTLVKLIARLYDPDEGSILFDGVDLRQLSLEHLHRKISFVFQHFGQYSATAADNIAYGNWQHLLDKREQIEQIAAMAGTHEMIEAMPQGYNTLLGRVFGDYTLSGGQWQRIAITRAFARDASLLILDEPTASLDARAEYELFARFKKLAQGYTTILISHRFSTVSMADWIIVMDQGRIIESGTHDELTSGAGHYAMLYDLHQRQMATALNGKGTG